MTRPLRIEYPDAHYHVTCRGNNKDKIFQVSSDRELFLKKLILSQEIYEVSILSYVLMNNHFHFLVKTPKGNLSQFMRHFNISYTSTFNKRHNRVGHLYQGRYKAFLIEEHSYLMEISRYSHVNPIRIKKYDEIATKEKWEILINYSASSLPGYLTKKRRKGRGFVDYDTLLFYEGGDTQKGRAGYKYFVQSGIVGNIDNPLKIGVGHSIVGTNEFIDQIKEKYIDIKKPRREQPALKELAKDFTPEELIAQFCLYKDMDQKRICKRGINSNERSMLMELLYRFCNITQPEIGRFMGGIDYSAVSQARKRFNLKLSKDSRLRSNFKDTSSHLSRLKI